MNKREIAILAYNSYKQGFKDAMAVLENGYHKVINLNEEEFVKKFEETTLNKLED